MGLQNLLDNVLFSRLHRFVFLKGATTNRRRSRKPSPPTKRTAAKNASRCTQCRFRSQINGTQHETTNQSPQVLEHHVIVPATVAAIRSELAIRSAPMMFTRVYIRWSNTCSPHIAASLIRKASFEFRPSCLVVGDAVWFFERRVKLDCSVNRTDWERVVDDFDRHCASPHVLHFFPI